VSPTPRIRPALLDQAHSGRRGASVVHRRLLRVVRTDPRDYAPDGSVEHEGADCSGGCRWYLPLAGPLGADWGVCANRLSHRAGLLTFEHQGCGQFEASLDVEDDRG
jgi:hypothetical protein